MLRTPDSTSFDTFATFGDLLKYLRRRERLTQLELSISVGYSEAQISRLEKNQRLPDLSAIKALFIPALNLQDEPQLAARLLELAQSARQQDTPTPGIPPYKGLLFFDESDVDLFFGREELTARLVEHVHDLAMDASNRFLAVVGASGSGKSSLVRAGLAVALRKAGWQVRVFTPASNPIRMLQANLAALSSDLTGQTLLLIDQFEEIFTLCHDETERSAFIDQLFNCAQDPSQRITVVITLRADFYSHCAHYPQLRLAVAAEQQYIGQMTLNELRRAVEEPARREGWELEPGLVEVMLQDISVRGAQVPEPGALPLLSHALLATWERRRGRMLTLDGYHAAGGVRGAIAETAEEVFTDQLNRAQQEIAQYVFLRLTELGEGTEDTRRRASLNELARESEEAAQLRAVLNTLAAARLITLNEDNAEVAHEALIREWQRLHEWLTLDREGLLLHRHLTEAAYEWNARDDDPAELYRGARLAQAREWVLPNEEKLNALERAFLAASIEQEEHDTREREAHRQHELDAARELAETQKHAARQSRRLALTLLGVLVLAVGAAILAGSFASRNSTLAGQNAAIAGTAQAVSTQALADFTRSEAQRLAAEASSLAQSGADPQLIALLSLRSLRTQYTAEGDTALTAAAALPLPEAIYTDQEEGVYSVDFSPAGEYVLIGSYDGKARLIDRQTGAEIRQFTANEEDRGVKAIFSPDGSSIYASSNDGTVWRWDRNTGKVLLQFSLEDAPVDIEISPDGSRMLTGSSEGTPRLLDALSGTQLCQFNGHSAPVWEATFSPDGQYVATASLDKTARLWKADNCEPVKVFQSTDSLRSVDFSPDGKFLATAGADGPAKLWQVETGELLRQFVGHTCSNIRSVRFSPDGKYLLTGSCDRTARLWEVQTGLPLQTFSGHTDQIWTVAFSDDGHSILTGAFDRTAWLWDLQAAYGEHPQFVGHTSSVFSLDISPDGLLVATGADDASTRLWDARSGQVLDTLEGQISAINSLAFSPDGRYLVTSSLDGSAWLWDLQTRQVVQRFAHDPSGESGIMGVTFSPDGKYILTAGEDAYAKRWDAQTGNLLTVYGLGTDRIGWNDTLYGVAYSPDGKSVLTGGWDGVMRLYDAESGNEIRQFTGHTDRIYGVAFSPDGRKVLSGSKDLTARAWDVDTGLEVQQLTGHTAYLYAVAFSADGRLVLTSSADNTARLWDLQSGQELRRFNGHKGPVEWATFSPDGNTFLTASDDGSARVWNINVSDSVDYLCAHLLRDFTPAEREQYLIGDDLPTCANLAGQSP